MNTDYDYLASSLSTLAALPVRLYRDGIFQGLYHHTKFKPDLAILEEPNIFRSNESVSYYMDENFLYYGLFRVKKDAVALLIGPVSQMPVNNSLAAKILRFMGEPASRAKELVDYFSTIPSYPLRTFLQILCTVNYFINGEKTDVSQLLLEEELPMEAPAREHTSEQALHNTMDFEEVMLSHVQHGRVDEIEAMFRGAFAGRAGTMASDTLRQQKNLLICTATLVTRAAIRGGLNREQAFALSDLYIQKAELMADVLSLTRLNAQMVLDFTRRVNEEKSGIHHAKLARKVRDHILSHIGQPITTDDLARTLGMNRTYLCKRFVEETGLTINQYVTQVKMEEARRLMDITQKSIAEIAEYLGYSSQSYFQRVFKKTTQMTPGEYRSHKNCRCV